MLGILFYTGHSMNDPPLRYLGQSQDKPGAAEACIREQDMSI